jgi:hypothetical protein
MNEVEFSLKLVVPPTDNPRLLGHTAARRHRWLGQESGGSGVGF